MRRPTLLLLLAALLGGVAVAPASAATFGISDQQASTFTNPLYKPLKLKAARYIAPYDVVSDPSQRRYFTAWYDAASKAGQRMLVSFEHSRTARKQQSLPTKGQYSTAMKVFFFYYT